MDLNFVVRDVISWINTHPSDFNIKTTTPVKLIGFTILF